MKTKMLLIGIIAAILLISMKPVQGPHNGIVKPAGEFNIEIRNTYDYFFAYLLDKNQIPLSNKDIQCEVKFVHADATSTNMPLKPYGEDGFFLTAPALQYNTCRVYFTINGKLVSALFENQNLIVEKQEEHE